MIAECDPPTAMPAAGTATMTNAAVREMNVRLERRHAFREPDPVWTFLAAHSDLIDLAIDAAVKSPEFPPTDEPIALQVVRDPEDDDAAGESFAILATRREPAAVGAAIESLDREWLVDAARPVGLLLNVGVDCS